MKCVFSKLTAQTDFTLRDAQTTTNVISVKLNSYVSYVLKKNEENEHGYYNSHLPLIILKLWKRIFLDTIH